MPRGGYDMSSDALGIIFEKIARDKEQQAKEEKALAEEAMTDGQILGKRPAQGGDAPVKKSKNYDYGRGWGNIPERKYKSLAPKPNSTNDQRPSSS